METKPALLKHNKLLVTNRNQENYFSGIIIPQCGFWNQERRWDNTTKQVHKMKSMDKTLEI